MTLVTVPPTTVWCAHKAVVRETLIQIASREKKKKLQRITTLQKSIADLGAKHKNPTFSSTLVRKNLNYCREELRQELRAEYDIHISKDLNYHFMHKTIEQGSCWAPNSKNAKHAPTSRLFT